MSDGIARVPNDVSLLAVRSPGSLRLPNLPRAHRLPERLQERGRCTGEPGIENEQLEALPDGLTTVCHDRLGIRKASSNPQSNPKAL